MLSPNLSFFFRHDFRGENKKAKRKWKSSLNVFIINLVYQDGLFSYWSKPVGRVVWKTVNTNPELKVNRTENFSCIKMFFIQLMSCVVSDYSTSKQKAIPYQEKPYRNVTKLRSKFSLVLLIGFWPTRPSRGCSVVHFRSFGWFFFS